MEWFQDVLEALPDATVVTGEDGRIVFINSQTENLFGYSRDQLLGKSVEKLIPPSSRGKHADHRSSYLVDRLRRPVGSSVEFCGLRKDGTEFPIEIILGSAKRDEGTFITESIRDISKRRRVDKEDSPRLREANDIIDATGQLRTDYLAKMSHEIRTPLNAIIGTAELQMLTEMTPQQRRQSGIIKASGELLLSIVNDILDVSKISADKLTLEEVDFDFIEMVESLVDTFAAVVRAKDVELALSLDPQVPAGLRGDAPRIRQILSNLLSNAIKFTPAGEVLLRVSLMEATGSDVTLRFEVKDTGIGITREAQSQLFQPFIETEESISRHYGGTGIGLVIAQQLVGRMGGKVQAESEPGKGSSFHFVLRLKKGAEIRRPWMRESIPTFFKNTRALIVGDGAFNRQVVSEYLNSWTIASFAVSSSAAALHELRLAAERNLNYDFVLLEEGLPNTGGMSLPRIIRKDSLIRDTRLIMMSTDPGTTATAQDVDSWIIKPIRPSFLFNCLHKLLSRDSSVSNYDLKGKSPKLHAVIPQEARVLVVEDNPTNQTLAKAQLNALGYTADIVGDASGALDALLDTRYDVVLMDCELPGMDGFAATAELRRREGDTRHTSIIALTAHATEADRWRCLQAGMDGYLAKPTKLQALAEMLNRWHGKPAASGAI